MELFLQLLTKIIPFYALIFLGFLAAKKLASQKETVARLLIYIITPVIVFHGTVSVDLTPGTLALPIIFFVLGSFLSGLFYFIGKNWWQDETRNLLAFSAGSGNTGYFGLPVTVALLGQEALGLAVLCTLGMIFYENTVGFYLAARGKHSATQALFKLLKLPIIYAFLAGIIVNLIGLNLGSIYLDFAVSFRGAYTILGMMLVGLSLVPLAKGIKEKSFIISTFLAKFLAWPALAFGIIFLDVSFFQVMNSQIYNVIWILSIVPIAANTVSYATELKVHPEKAAVAVFLSTLFSILYIPLVAGLLLNKF